jgi:hypothetical protein
MNPSTTRVFTPARILALALIALATPERGGGGVAVDRVTGAGQAAARRVARNAKRKVVKSCGRSGSQDLTFSERASSCSKAGSKVLGRGHWFR